MTLTLTRSEELAARSILAHPEELGTALKEKRWSHVAAVVSLAKNDVASDLAITDPALYRELREQITRFYLRGGAALNLDKLIQLSQSAPVTTTH